MDNNQITHKELLAFSNITNLEWEFGDLEAIRTGDYDTGQGTMEGLSTQLNDLLDPKLFVRTTEKENEYGDKVTYVYGKRDKNGEYLEE